jgi:hypothetical protein
VESSSSLVLSLFSTPLFLEDKGRATAAVVVPLLQHCHTGSVGFTSSKQIRHAAIPSPVTCSERRSSASEKRAVSPSAGEDADSKVSKVVKYRSKIAKVYCAVVWLVSSPFSPAVFGLERASSLFSAANVVEVGVKDQVAPPGRMSGIAELNYFSGVSLVVLLVEYSLVGIRCMW